jgi:hypothetical protein
MIVSIETGQHGGVYSKGLIATPLADLEGGLRGLSASQCLALKGRNQALRICRRCRAEGLCSLSPGATQAVSTGFRYSVQRRLPWATEDGILLETAAWTGSWVGDCAAVPKSAGGSALVVRCLSVLYWTGRWRLLVVSLRRKVEACSLCVFLRRDGEGEVVRLDPAQHPCLITCCIS